jgi:hypothetical protein
MLGLVGAAFIAGATPAKAGAQATANPSTGLSNGDVVTVAWSDFPAETTVNVFQCARPPSVRTCAVSDGKLDVRSDRSGAGQVAITVRTGPLGQGMGQCPGPVNDCVIVVNVAGSEDPRSNILLPISFAGAPVGAAPVRTELARTGGFHLGLALTGTGAVLAGVVLVQLVELPPGVPATARSDAPGRGRGRYRPRHRRRSVRARWAA